MFLGWSIRKYLFLCLSEIQDGGRRFDIRDYEKLREKKLFIRY
jgi:hypothetical protein